MAVTSGTIGITEYIESSGSTSTDPDGNVTYTPGPDVEVDYTNLFISLLVKFDTHNTQIAQQNTLLAEQNTILTQRNTLLAEQNTILTQRNTLLAEQNTIHTQIEQELERIRTCICNSCDNGIDMCDVVEKILKENHVVDATGQITPIQI